MLLSLISSWLSFLVNLGPLSYNATFIFIFTKSVNSNFRAFSLALVTRNILGYLLLCDRSQDGVSFGDIFGRRNLGDK